MTLEQDVYLAFTSDGRWADVPDELYLRELIDLDLQDPSAICGFTRLYGRLGDSGQRRGEDGLHRLAIFAGDELVRIHNAGQSAAEDWLGVAAARLAADEGIDYADALDRYLYEPPGPEDVQHIDEFRAHARALRNLVRIWDYHLGGRTFDELRQQWELVGGGLYEPPDTPSRALHLFSALLSHGLVPFHVRVDLRSASDSPARHDGARADLYAKLCLQIYNHVAEGATYQRCANENCRRLFVRQRGRAAQGQNRRRGLQYCSVRCGQAQAHRQLWHDKRRAREMLGLGAPAEAIAVALGRPPETIRRWVRAGT
ncbi:MAG: hypothetical protein M1565_06085 [Actinobacteria bacterium]|nr:hypothetical protein [Actinomycetota bacterium]